MAYRLKFANLGRNKVSWEGGLREKFPEEYEILRLAREHGELLSHDLYVEYVSGSPERGKWQGHVVGGMQTVGDFEVVTA